MDINPISGVPVTEETRWSRWEAEHGIGICPICDGRGTCEGEACDACVNGVYRLFLFLSERGNGDYSLTGEEEDTHYCRDLERYVDPTT